MSGRRDRPDSLRAVMHGRREELSTRLVAAGLMVICYAIPIGIWAAALWGLVFVTLQLVELRLFGVKKPVLRDVNSRLATPVFLSLLAANSAIFGFGGILCLFANGSWGGTAATLVIAGGMLHAVITTTSAGRAFRAATTPYMVCLGVIVLVLSRSHAPVGVVGGIAFGSVLLGLATIKLWRRAALIQAQQLDTTDALEQALEQAQVANMAKSTFLATMSHEIRTPLNGVLGMAQAMAKDPLSPTQSDRLDIIQQSGAALLAILNDILDLSKIEANELLFEDVEFGLTGLMRGAHSTFTEVANRKGLSFSLVLTPQAEGVYRGDPTRLRQVVYNLVSNALKFTEVGRVGVHVDSCDGLLRVAVTDTGIGIDVDQIDGLFRPFAQGDASITRRFGGTGLGLAVSRELVHRMGGELAVESSPGVGSRFYFTVAVPRLCAEPQGEVDAALDEAPSLGGTLRVLAAEDNVVNQLVLRTLLTQAGVIPVIVKNGALAVAACAEAPWDVVLMDVHMPEMDGISALRAIRAHEEARSGRRTPIIMLTADVMSHHVTDYRESGADGIVAKPLDAATLFAEIEKVLDAVNDPFERLLVA